MRPSINIPQAKVIDLDGFFGLHPSLAPLKPLWDQKQQAIVHAAGSPDATRSHFDAQDFMESGTPGVKATSDGWLNRALQSENTSDSPFRAIALGTSSSAHSRRTRASRGRKQRINGFGIAGGSPVATPISSTFEAMYAHAGPLDSILHGTGAETF